MIVTTIPHSGDVHATADDVREFLGDTAKVTVHYDDASVAHVAITRVNADGGEHVTFLPPRHRLVSVDGGVTFAVEEIVYGPEHYIQRLENAVDHWRRRWLEESRENERLHGVVAGLEARLESWVSETVAGA